MHPTPMLSEQKADSPPLRQVLHLWIGVIAQGYGVDNDARVVDVVDDINDVRWSRLHAVAHEDDVWPGNVWDCIL